jgi:hypothetical protein
MRSSLRKMPLPQQNAASKGGGGSGDVFAEYEEVLRRPRFNRSDSEILATLRTIRGKGFWVKPTERVSACTDRR